MSSRIVLLIGLILTLALAALGVSLPPDGVERIALAQFLGRFHVMAVHLPIGLLLAVAVMDLVGASPRHRVLREAAGFVLGFATLSAVGSALLGWLLAFAGGYSGKLVSQHMWGGFILCAVSVLALAVRRSFVAPERRGLGYAYPPLLLLAIVTMLWTAHQGGKLVHGETFLTQHSPFRTPSPGKVSSPGKKGAVNSTPAANAAATEASFYAVRVAPALDRTCVGCHNANKHKAGLRLDTYALLMQGGENGPVVKAGDPAGSELYHRITLPPEDEDFMPSDGKKPLAPEEVKWIELWIAAGASATAPLSQFTTAPAPHNDTPAILAPDYQPYLAKIAAFEKQSGGRLVPRSRHPTDGLILRTASAPSQCTDAVLAQLGPVAGLIVEAELARTKITDTGLRALAACKNLRVLDLSNTKVTAAGLASLAGLEKLERLNLTDTGIDSAAIARLHLKAAPQIYPMPSAEGPEAN